MCRNKLTQVAGYSAVKPNFYMSRDFFRNSKVRTFTFNGTTFHLQLVLKVQDSRLNDNKLHGLLILFIRLHFVNATLQTNMDETNRQKTVHLVFCV